MADPIHQFKIVPIPGLDFGEVTLPIIGTVHLAVTNSHVAMTLAFAAVSISALSLFNSAPRWFPAVCRPRAKACSV